MKVCAENHIPIAYTEMECPLCLVIQELAHLQQEYAKMEIELKEKKENNAD